MCSPLGPGMSKNAKTISFIEVSFLLVDPDLIEHVHFMVFWFFCSSICFRLRHLYGESVLIVPLVIP